MLPIWVTPSAHSAAISIAIPARMSGDSTREPCSGRGPLTIARCGSQIMIDAPIPTSLSQKYSRFSNIHSWIRRCPRLGGERQRDARQVGRERRPGAVLDLRDVIAVVVLDPQLLVAGNDDVVATPLGPQAEPAEHQADHPQVVRSRVLDDQLAAGDAGERHERADLDVIGRDRVRAAAQAGLSMDGDHVGADPVDRRRPCPPASAPGPGRGAPMRRCGSRSSRASARPPSARSRSPSPTARPSGSHMAAAPARAPSAGSRCARCGPWRRAARNASMCGSSRRRPITSPPGGGIVAEPKRASSGPASRNEARIRSAKATSTVVLVDLGGVDLDLAGCPSIPRGRRAARSARASPRRRRSAGRWTAPLPRRSAGTRR